MSGIRNASMVSYVIILQAIEVSGKSKKITSRSSNDPDPSGMKVWFTPPGKKTPLAEVLAAAEEVWSGY